MKRDCIYDVAANDPSVVRPTEIIRPLFDDVGDSSAVQFVERFPSKGADTYAYLGDMLRRLGMFENAAENYARAYQKDSL